MWLISACVAFLLMVLLLSSAEHHETVKTLSSYKDVFTGDHAQIVELEGLTMAKSFPEDTEKDPRTLDSLTAALRGRFSEVTAGDADPYYPDCPINPARYDTITASSPALWRRKGVVGIAVNVHNSQDILPGQAIALLEAAYYLLDKNRNKVYISVYENGSNDKTGRLLSEFAAAAQALGVHGIWVTTSRMANGPGQDRMVMLSEIRNHAIMPLLPYLSPSGGGAAQLVFLNDVITCASDILEVVHQQRLQRGDMVMGTDWNNIDGKARLYDMWVARGINGGLSYVWDGNSGLTPTSPGENWVHDVWSTQNQAIWQRWLDGRPFPLYCAWGGMVAFDAALFTKQHLRFRSSISSGWTVGSANRALGDWGRLVADDYLRSDCPGASECEYICRDVWNLKHGKARIVLASQARTMYTTGDWRQMIDQVPQTRRTDRETSKDEIINWEGVTMPTSVSCIPSRNQEGNAIDCWSVDRYNLNPFWDLSIK